MSENVDVPSSLSAFVLQGVKSVVFEDRSRPRNLKPTDVLVAPKKTGICGSDTHYLLSGRIGDFVVEKPMILGHESAGVVVEVGSEVTSLKIGDRVAMEPGESCRTCASCKEGHYERCPDMVFAATPPYDGTLCAFYALPSDLCYKLPESVSMEEGALVNQIEPMSVAVMAVHSVGQMPHNANVVVFGAGPVGLLTMAVAKALGARHVLAVDIQEDRLKFATSYAANDFYIPAKPKEGEPRIAYSRAQAEAIRERFGFEERGPAGVDLVVDCTGAEVCIQTGMFLLRHGGTFVQVGMGAEKAEIPIATVLIRELTVKGSFRYGPGCYQMAIDLVARGAVSLKPLITHRYAFKDAEAAFETNRTGRGADGKSCIKAIIDGPL